MVSSRRFFAWLGLIALLATANAAHADEVDNPRYKAWASYKVGSSETLTSKTKVAQLDVTLEIKITLKEVADDHVTVEVASTRTVNGRETKDDPITQLVKAKIDAKDFKKLPDDNDVTAMGKTFKCKVCTGTYDLAAQAGRSTPAATAMFWTNDDVPGGLVKMDVKMKRPGADQEVGLTYELKGYEAK